MSEPLATALERVVGETAFSGVVHVSRAGETLYEQAHGLADRAHGIANTVDTRFGIASGSKTFTALAVMALVADGALTLDASVRSFVPELDDVDPAVTVEHLLTHTSGIGDYLDEESGLEIDEYVLTRPVHELTSPAAFLPMLLGHPTKFAPGERFEYCNGGYAILAIVVEVASGASYYDVVTARVLDPAGMVETSFPRSDELPGSAALGYLGAGPRTNVFHLPVRATGDGGAFSTAADVARFWPALFGGRIVDPTVVEEMVLPRHTMPSDPRHYGMGFWLRPDRDTVMLEGYDAGVSFRSGYTRASALLYTVLSNTSEGAWPVVRALDDVLPGLVAP